MRIYKLLGMCLALVFVTTVAQAQVTDRAKNRAENRANQRVDQKVDQAVDKAADKLESLFKKKQETTPEPTDDTSGAESTTDEASQEQAAPSMGKILGGLGMGGKFEPYQNEVLMNMSMDITTANARGKEDKMTMHLTLDTWATGINAVTEDGQNRILLDNKEGSMTVITTSKDGTQGFKMRQPVFEDTALEPDDTDVKITDLGNTRTIDGYKCREYLIEHEEGTSNAWLTKDLDIDPTIMARAFATQARQAKQKNTMNFQKMEGFPIEVTTVSKNGKDTTVAHYYNIKIGNIDKSVFDTSGVEIMSLGF